MDYWFYCYYEGGKPNIIGLTIFTQFQNCQEAVTRRFFVKKVFLEISQNSQENTYARDSFLKKLQAVLTEHLQCTFCLFTTNISARESILKVSDVSQPVLTSLKLTIQTSEQNDFGVRPPRQRM